MCDGSAWAESKQFDGGAECINSSTSSEYLLFYLYLVPGTRYQECVIFRILFCAASCGVPFSVVALRAATLYDGVTTAVAFSYSYLVGRRVFTRKYERRLRV